VNRVFILGAGFSKAINPGMPLLGELAEGVRSVLRGRRIEIGAGLEAIGDVERWLTFLADPAPWLSLSAQQRNAALFTDVSEAIHEILTAKQMMAAVQAPPGWLLPLVSYWHRVRATVITFNYDCLVELAYLDVMADAGGGRPSDLYGIPITSAALRVAAPYGRQKASSFKLLKLHGSLAWWYSGPEAGQSDSIYEMAWAGTFGRGTESAYADLGGDLLVATSCRC